MDILDEIKDPTFKALAELAESRFPGFEIKFKNESRYMKFLNVFARLFNPRFMDDYVTTLGSKVYFPSRDKLIKNGGSYAEVLAHELVHIEERDEQGDSAYFLRYAFPQILAALALISICAVWSPWFLLALVFLLALAPLPSPGRRDIELNGYEMSLSFTFWKYGKITDEDVEWYARQFSGPAYYFMWPWHKSVVHELKLRAIGIRTGDNLQKPLFREIHDIVMAARLR